MPAGQLGLPDSGGTGRSAVATLGWVLVRGVDGSKTPFEGHGIITVPKKTKLDVP